MSFKESDSDILTKISNRYIKRQAVFTGGGTVYSDPTYTGRQFTSSGTLVVGTAGYFTALIIDAGTNGGNGTPDGYWPDGGAGGSGGIVRVITGYLNTGNYTITIATGGGTATGFTPTSTSNTTSFGGGVGGRGYDAGIFVNSPAMAGSSGPTITIAPFTNVLASGGGGGGGGGTVGEGGTGTYGYVGAGASGRTGGAAAQYDGNLKSSITYGGGGGGGGRIAGVHLGGTGGPGYFWIVSSILSSDISSTNNITNYKIDNGNYTLSNLLDNYMAVTYNPNVKMYEIKGINNVTNYVDCLKLSGTGITDYLSINSYNKHPFTIDSYGDDNYYCNYYNGYYTLIFTATGTYTMTTSAGVTLNLDTIVVGNGGNGGASSSGKFASSGGGGGVRRALFVMGPLSSFIIYADTVPRSLTLPANMRWSIVVNNTTYTGASNGSGGSSNYATSVTVGSNGDTFAGNIPEAPYTNIIGNYTISPTANVAFNNGIDAPAPAPYVLSGTGKFLGGRGASPSGGVPYGNIAGGGFYGLNGSSPSGATPIGFGAGAGVAANGTATYGNRGIIIISFAYP